MLTWLTTSDRGNRPGLVAMIPGSEAASFPGFGGRRTSSQGLLINEIRVLRVLSDSGDPYHDLSWSIMGLGTTAACVTDRDAKDNLRVRYYFFELFMLSRRIV